MNSTQVHLLLIDDDDIDRESVRRLLSQTYTMQEAAMGQDGLTAVDRKRPHLVLLDYRLPDVDSFDVLSKLVAKDIPVIVLTGEESPGVIVAAMQQGAEDYLIKGRLSKDSLDWAINNALAKANLKQSVREQQRLLSQQAKTLEDQNRQIRTLASALTLAEQRERRRIAQILHDHIQQLLYGVQMRLHLITEDMPRNACAAIHENLSEATKLLEETIGAARSLAVDLSPPILKDEGIGVTLQWLATQMQQVHDLKVELQISTDYDYRADSEELQILIFQLVRELLFNVVKHADVKTARLRVYAENGRQMISVEDSGIGFDVENVVRPKWKPEQGFGLYSVRERLALFGGRLNVNSQPGDGACVTIILPEKLAPNQ